MNILNWLIENWFLIVIFLCFFGKSIINTINFLLMEPNKRLLFIRENILNLVLIAEKELGSKTGEMKLKLVITTFYKKYPFARLIFPENKLIELIEESVVEMKNILKYKEDLRQ